MSSKDIITFSDPEEIPFGVFSNYYPLPITLSNIYSEEYLKMKENKKKLEHLNIDRIIKSFSSNLNIENNKETKRKYEDIEPQKEYNIEIIKHKKLKEIEQKEYVIPKIGQRKSNEEFPSIMNFIGYILLKTPQYKILVQNTIPSKVQQELLILRKKEFENELYNSFQIALANKYNSKSTEYNKILIDTNKSFLLYKEDNFEYGANYDKALMLQRNKIQEKNNYKKFFQNQNKDKIYKIYMISYYFDNLFRLEEIEPLIPIFLIGNINECDIKNNNIDNILLCLIEFFKNQKTLYPLLPENKVINNFISGKMGNLFNFFINFPDKIFIYYQLLFLQRFSLEVEKYFYESNEDIKLPYIGISNNLEKETFDIENIKKGKRKILENGILGDEIGVNEQKKFIQYKFENYRKMIKEKINQLLKDPTLTIIKEMSSKNMTDEYFIFVNKYFNIPLKFYEKRDNKLNKEKTLLALEAIDNYFKGIYQDYYALNNIVDRTQPIIEINTNDILSPYNTKQPFFVNNRKFNSIIQYSIFHLYKFFLNYSDDKAYKNISSNINLSTLIKNFLKEKIFYELSLYKDNLYFILWYKLSNKYLLEILISSEDKKIISKELFDEGNNILGKMLEEIRTKIIVNIKNNINAYRINFIENSSSVWVNDIFMRNLISHKIFEFENIYKSIKKYPEFKNIDASYFLETYFQKYLGMVKNNECYFLRLSEDEKIINELKFTIFNNKLSIKQIWNYLALFFCYLQDNQKIKNNLELANFLVKQDWDTTNYKFLDEKEFLYDNFSNRICIAIIFIFRRLKRSFFLNNLSEINSFSINSKEPEDKIKNDTLFSLIGTILMNKPIQVPVIENMDMEIEQEFDFSVISNNPNLLEEEEIDFEEELFKYSITGNKSMININELNDDISKFLLEEEENMFSEENMFEDQEKGSYDSMGFSPPVVFRGENLKNYLLSSVMGFTTNNVTEFIKYIQYLIQYIIKIKKSQKLKDYWINRQILLDKNIFL